MEYHVGRRLQACVFPVEKIMGKAPYVFSAMECLKRDCLEFIILKLKVGLNAFMVLCQCIPLSLAANVFDAGPH
jgi:hypothetical protein